MARAAARRCRVGAVKTMSLLAFDSITLVPATLQGRSVLAASHGGIFVARAALRLGLGGLIVSDAGIGRERAGVIGLDLLEQHAVPAAAVSVHSSRIGDGADCLRRGVISTLNEAARRIGLAVGMAAHTALEHLSQHPRAPAGLLPELADEHRQVQHANGRQVVIVDSNSLVGPGDGDSIVVTGSHGALLGGRAGSAVKWPVMAAIYNDADGGIDGAGFSRLAALDAGQMAAATVSAWSARIGDARSTLADGYVTRVNSCAQAAGARVGMSCLDLVAGLSEWRPQRG